MDRHLQRVPHICRPPTAPGRRIENGTWTCPDCGSPWHVEPRRTSNPRYLVDITTDAGQANGEWFRGPKLRGRLN
jgi:hypothetical protein